MKEVLRFRAVTIPGFTVFDVIGRSFAMQMVRRMVTGVVLAIREGLDVERLLEEPKPRAVPPAPPEGLVLMDMKLDTYVPGNDEAIRRARKRLEDLWRFYRLRSKLLSDRWIVH